MKEGYVEVGCARADITPPLGCNLAGSYNSRIAQRVGRPLEANVLVVSDGERKIAFVVLDLILLEPRDVASIKAEAATRLGYSTDAVVVSCTHTHTGPSTGDLHMVPREEEYVNSLPARIVPVLEQAEGALKPARFAGAWGLVNGVCFNRRLLRTDGKVEMNAAPTETVRPIRSVGPVDSSISVLYFEDDKAKPLALSAALALHYVGGQDGNCIDPDYFRNFRDIIGEQMGGFGVLSNGASGDINNVDHFHLDTYKADMQAVAEKVAAEAMRAAREWPLQDGPLDIQYATRSFVAPRRMPTPEMLREAEKIVAEVNEETDQMLYGNAKAQIRMAGGQTERTFELIAGRIGQVAYLGLPSEVFCEIGMAIKARSPFPMLHLLGNTNGWNGYIPAKHCFAEGSYETDLTGASFCAEDTGDRMIEESLILLESLK